MSLTMIIRYGFALTSGILVTLTLFWLMTTLISLHHGNPLPPRERGILDFYKMTREKPVKPAREQLYHELTEPLDVPPARPQADRYDGTGYRRIAARVPTPDFESPVATTLPDGPLVAMVRVAPVYPPRLLAMNLEGWVLVQFDVNPDGSVANPAVVESSHSAFDKAAIDAVLKFRYKARVIDGVPQMTTGLKNLFRFEIDGT